MSNPQPQPNQPGNPAANRQIYNIEQLFNLVVLYEHITGQKLQVLEIKPDYLQWYIQEVNRTAEQFGLAPGFAGGRVMFSGVELKAKAQPSNIQAAPAQPAQPQQPQPTPEDKVPAVENAQPAVTK